MTPPTFDRHALLAKLREGDAAAEAQVLRDAFGSPNGRLALALILARAGVGERRGPGMSPEDRAYADGKSDGALQIMHDAGFDAPSAVIMVMTDEPLEGRDDERSSQPHPGAGTDPGPDASADPYADPHPQLE